jgi:putative cardiolipin synthase
MYTMLVIFVVGLVFIAGSMAAVYSYGQFARRSRGEPSFCLPTGGERTPLMEDLQRFLTPPEGTTGLAMVSSNLDAFAARSLSARRAGRSLDLMYHVWHSDLTGRLLAYDVLEAAKRGVRVRLILDDINDFGRDPAYLALDDHPNIEVRMFNPSRARKGRLRRGLEMALRPFSLTRRLHNKAWIADGTLAIVGGRNIGDGYFDAAETSNFRDLDLLVVGDAVHQTEGIFDQYWNSSVVIPIGTLSKQNDADRAALRQLLVDQVKAESSRPYLDHVRTRSDLALALDDLEMHFSDNVRVISDPPEKALRDKNERWLRNLLSPLVVGASRTLAITSPYFVPGNEAAKELVRLVASGVDVAILTNSLAATDVAAVHSGYARYRPQLIKGGVRLFELQPYGRKSEISLFGSSGTGLHTKAFVADEHIGFIGSFNFDPRSASLNTEMGVLFDHPPLARKMRDLFDFETSPSMSYRLSLSQDGKLRWEGEARGAPEVYDREPETRLRRRLVVRLLGWLPIHSQL